LSDEVAVGHAICCFKLLDLRIRSVDDIHHQIVEDSVSTLGNFVGNGEGLGGLVLRLCSLWRGFVIGLRFRSRAPKDGRGGCVEAASMRSVVWTGVVDTQTIADGIRGQRECDRIRLQNCEKIGNQGIAVLVQVHAIGGSCGLRGVKGGGQTELAVVVAGFAFPFR